MFIDEATIYVRSGRGGDGSVHFHREKYVSRGGPDGGDGGRGGDVVLEVVPTLNTLNAFRHKSKYVASSGSRGGVNNQTGKSAENLIIPVPPGTVVYDQVSNALLGDLVEAGQKLEVAKGGRGGRGNTHFATSRNQAPRTAERGEPYQERNIKLELKLIADIGIVGVPNAGKSSFLAAVTNANPKIADYPFTTLEPNLGVAELNPETILVLADIPGLIEGAHQGQGLGFAFLRHIQRTRVLIHILDGLSDDPLADLSLTNSELALFDPQLAKKPQVVAFNKMDLPEVEKRWPRIKADLEKRGFEPLPVSTVSHLNLDKVLWKAAELLKSTPLPEPSAELPVYRPPEDVHDYTIEKTVDGFRIKGAGIERAAAMTYWEYEGSVRRFQRLMNTIGVDDALREAGIEPGQTVYIGEYELEWQE
jgi:GTP-binding protein